MQMTDRQAHVLANIERVAPLAYKLNVSAPVPRYQLDGAECTPQITGLVVRKLIVKDENGRLHRADTPVEAIPRIRIVERQPHSNEAIRALRAELMAPVAPRRHRIAP